MKPIKNIRLSQDNLKIVVNLMSEKNISFNKALNIIIAKSMKEGK